jgi:hypothetical protein
MIEDVVGLTNRQEIESRDVAISSGRVAFAFVSPGFVPFRVSDDEADVQGD